MMSSLYAKKFKKTAHFMFKNEQMVIFLFKTFGRLKGIFLKNQGIYMCRIQIRGFNMNTNLPALEKMLNENLKKLSLKVKKIDYKMDFGSTEVVVKMGLN